MNARIPTLAFSFSLFLAGCATQHASWTPASVAPPPWSEPGAAPEPETAADAPHAVLPAPAEAPAMETRPLTLADAVVVAFENNLAIAVAELDPAIASTTVREARAEFDPNLSASLGYGRDTARTTTTSSIATANAQSGTAADPSTDALTVITNTAQSFQNLSRLVDSTTTAASRSDRTNGGAVISQYFPTGTTLSVSADYAGARNAPSDDHYSGSVGVELRQALLRGAGRGINLITVRQAENDAAIGSHSLRQQVLSTVNEVEQSYWELVLSRAVLRINEVAVALAEEQMRLNQDLLDAGRAVEADVLSAKAERATRLADLSDARARIEEGNLALIRLLNPDDPDRWQIRFEPVTAPEPVPVEVDAAESVERAMAYRPEIAQTRLAVANAELGTQRARNNLLPRVDLVATANSGAGGDRVSDAWDLRGSNSDESFGIGLEVDTALYRRAEKARLLRSRLQETQAGRQLADTEQEIETAVRRAAVEVQRLLDRLESTREAVVARGSELETAESRYRSGRSTNLDVMQVQRDFIQAQIDEVEAQVGYMETLAALYAAEGTLPERRGIAVAGEAPPDPFSPRDTDP